jgi:hypothetical protein
MKPFTTPLFPRSLGVTFGLGLVLAACGGGENTDIVDEPGIDAPPAIDAGPPDAEPGGIISDMSDADWVALCEEVLTEDANAGFQVAISGCIESDCEASATAVEDCIAELTIEPPDCMPPDAEEAIRMCDAPVADLDTCISAAYAPLALYPAATCATVAELEPFTFDLTTVPECDDLLAQCPDVFM